ncbi:hypothetical protein E3N88_11083 [Mikania micrantha]|uniref:non-specific serine/threonine protein kinase n=1 Tax=Mikania micrantha TaxID=192012 RepID=A0A5N6PE76_9ASTR|nr:hypothetical protein E3N88_11083 [Mikania micrantha]
MRCFHFTNGDRRVDGENADVSRSSARVSWASVGRSELSDSLELLTQRRHNDLRVFKFSELKSATKGFNRTLMIGEGGFGCVYRGVVNANDARDGDRCLDVAIKQLDRNDSSYVYIRCFSFQGHKEWINEVNFLGVANHPNLVKLVGYCAEDDERGIQRLLVYQFMSNKSLDDHLLGRGKSPLSWMTRLRIAQGAARGLAYLHEEMDFQLIFRDFKTSNILLDEDFTPKLSDFGLARQGPAAGLTHVSTVAQTEAEAQVPEETEDELGEEGCGGGNYMRRVFEFKELVSLRNRSCGRLDWRYWAHGNHIHMVDNPDSGLMNQDQKWSGNCCYSIAILINWQELGGDLGRLVLFLVVRLYQETWLVDCSTEPTGGEPIAIIWYQSHGYPKQFRTKEDFGGYGSR